jgi:23S rRNA (pseudouridine1915-N3)-methyltransferase
MQIHVLAVGKGNQGPEGTLFSTYTQRLPWKVTLTEIELKKTMPPEKRKGKEAELLLEACPKQAVRIVLDEHGKELTSQAFAEKILHFQQQGRSSFAFLIGGADGHGDAVLKGADLTLCLGRMTWPHMMVRAMLAEQLYRAHTILSGHPYHRA